MESLFFDSRVSHFSDLFKKLVNSFKKMEYSLNIRIQTACLVLNSVMVDSYAALFICWAMV